MVLRLAAVLLSWKVSYQGARADVDADLVARLRNLLDDDEYHHQFLIITVSFSLVNKSGSRLGPCAFCGISYPAANEELFPLELWALSAPVSPEK